MKLTKILNHMTLRELNNYAIEKQVDIEINKGVPEELIIEVTYNEINNKKRIR